MRIYTVQLEKYFFENKIQQALKVFLFLYDLSEKTLLDWGIKLHLCATLKILSRPWYHKT